MTDATSRAAWPRVDGPSGSQPYFPGLDSVRGIAALLVLAHHVELYKHREGVWSLYRTSLRSIVSTIGENAVHLFFVLSGFLITYLLLTEFAQRGSIQVRRFWMRRILRIWPLYFLTIGIAFALVPLCRDFQSVSGSYYGRLIAQVSSHPQEFVYYFLFMVPNVALFRGRLVPCASHTWSIGVEEQFYFIWPLLVSWFRRWLWLLLPLIAAKPLIIGLLAPEWYAASHVLPIEFMGFGGLAALIQHLRYSSGPFASEVRGIQRLARGVMAIACVGTLLYRLPYYWHGTFDVIGIIAFSAICRRMGEPRLLQALGRVSYGLYMYHPVVLFFVFTVCGVIRYQPSPAVIAIQYLAIGGLTWLISELSMKFFEQPFLKLKTRYQTTKPHSQAERDEAFSLPPQTSSSLGLP